MHVQDGWADLLPIKTDQRGMGFRQGVSVKFQAGKGRDSETTRQRSQAGMSTQELLRIVQERGLKLELREGQPMIVGPRDKEHITDELIAVLKIHKPRIIEMLRQA